MKPLKKPSGQTWARFAYDFRERAEKAEKERDEARAEVARLKASVENLDALYVSTTDNLRECEAELRDVAERQREACALAYLRHPDAGEDEMAELYAEVIRATPLVTEEDK